MKKFLKLISMVAIAFVFVVLGSFGMDSFSDTSSASAMPGVFDIKINFQPRNALVPMGYMPDYGEIKSNKLLYNYGWNFSHEDYTAKRNKESDERKDTNIALQKDGIWEIELLSGRYDVTVSVGDAVYKTDLLG